ncbi:MAG: hypothetical protein M1829_000710, partial [Trizodia sp. TS-e1964]
MFSSRLGDSIPSETPHAVSVSLPTWRSNIGYEEGADWVVSQMKTGYPRFFFHEYIQKLGNTIISKHGKSWEQALLFPSLKIASQCALHFYSQEPLLSRDKLRLIMISPKTMEEFHLAKPTFFAIIYPRDHHKIAKSFWQHAGQGISSRQAEYIILAYESGRLQDTEIDLAMELKKEQKQCRGPRRYQKMASIHHTVHSPSPPPKEGALDFTKSKMLEGPEFARFVEERFGRNLDLSFAPNAKLAIRRRIAGCIAPDANRNSIPDCSNIRSINRVAGLAEEDVYLYPTGMSAIFNTHRTILAARGPMKSVCYGFSYCDTLKILQKWGPGCLFYGHCTVAELDDLEQKLIMGERFLALFCEFPSNPLLKSPDMSRIRSLADRFDFLVVVDETVGNFLNVNVLPFADVVVSSLTKIFSGDANAMGGSAVFNPSHKYHQLLKGILATDYEDNYWPEDAIFMERNSRDFALRIGRINKNAEAIFEVLRAHPQTKEVFYPKYNSTRELYDRCRNPDGGYGGLLTVTFYNNEDATAFYDSLDTAKGPSLGTNFTLRQVSAYYDFDGF